MNTGFNLNAVVLRAGKMLIAEPFMPDPNFSRTVILLCEHGEEGTIGFVMNRPTDLQIGTLFPDSEMAALSVYQGGPVQLDTLCVLLRTQKEDTGHQIIPGIYWGSAFESLEAEISTGEKSLEDVQVYLGYSGWSAGQLAEELQSGNWLVADANPKLIFETPREDLWRKALETLGEGYKNLANLPADPQLN